MLNFFFWLLLLANAGLIAYRQGYLNSYFPDGREPAHMATQIQPEKVRLVTPAMAAASATTAAKPELGACAEIGNFDAVEAARFELRLAAVAPGVKYARRTIQDTARNMVLIPPQASREAAEKKAGELRRRGVTDFFVIHDGELRWGISLGIFKTEDAARSHLATLTQKGVHSARLGLFNAVSNKAVFQMRGLDAAGSAAVMKVKGEFGKQELRGCEA